MSITKGKSQGKLSSPFSHAELPVWHNKMKLVLQIALSSIWIEPHAAGHMMQDGYS
jgi:hypothetical protein